MKVFVNCSLGETSQSISKVFVNRSITVRKINKLPIEVRKIGGSVFTALQFFPSKRTVFVLFRHKPQKSKFLIDIRMVELRCNFLYNYGGIMPLLYNWQLSALPLDYSLFIYTETIFIYWQNTSFWVAKWSFPTSGQFSDKYITTLMDVNRPNNSLILRN